jgi:hypothetical protein
MWKLLLGSCLLLPSLAGGSSFQREWDASTNVVVPAGDISGRWEGTWQNSSNTYQDKMRAILTRVGPNEYVARFHAKYFKILSFAYQTTFKGSWEGNEFVFRGEVNLGWYAGGVYRYAGRISPTNFFSTYDNRHNSGTYTLKRPTIRKCPAQTRLVVVAGARMGSAYSRRLRPHEVIAHCAGG